MDKILKELKRLLPDGWSAYHVKEHRYRVVNKEGVARNFRLSEPPYDITKIIKRVNEIAQSRWAASSLALA